MTDTEQTVRQVERYSPASIEKKWQERWAETGIYEVDLHSDKPGFYFLTMYPYPSGNLHAGHWYAEVPADAAARFKRMRGNNVFFPMGFDAFGLPAENAAIRAARAGETVHPASLTYSQIDRMRGQFEQMGAMFDWSKTLNTCDPSYYRWNQWFFLQMFERGLAYRKESFVNWDPVDQTVLANEQVIDGRADRSGALVERRLMPQWHLKITDYADELLDFSGLDWPDNVKTQQTNWIGRSEGAEVTFKSERGDELKVFTTRPDTLWGATFMVMAPEHPLVKELTSEDRKEAVEAYVKAAARKSEVERQADTQDKTGEFIGAYATNPVNGERLPIWISDYVLLGYGTGVIMAVPAHDERDFEFATKFGLDIRYVVQPESGEQAEGAWGGEGIMVNSGDFDGLSAGKDSEGARRVIAWLQEQGLGEARVTYRLRDWLISRQRYWGTPIPMLYCDECGLVPEKEENLPVLLPEDVEFMPTGESPLKHHPDFQSATCPNCGGHARRETDTMDTFMDSSWYWFRFLSPDLEDAPIDRELAARVRFTDGLPHFDAADEQQVWVDNVIIIQAPHNDRPDLFEPESKSASIEIALWNEPDGYYPAVVMRDGVVYEGFWARRDRELGSGLQLKFGNNEPIPLKPGRSWVMVVRWLQRDVVMSDEYADMPATATVIAESATPTPTLTPTASS